MPSAEAQAAAIADDIAYDAHDIDDGLRAGLFTLETLRAVPLPRRNPGRDRRALARASTAAHGIHELMRRRHHRAWSRT